MTLYYSDDTVELHLGDCRDVIPALGRRFDCAITDPPYEETALDWDIWPKGWLETVAAVTDSMWCWLPMRQFAEPPFRGIEFAAAGWKLSHDIEGEWDVAVDHMTWEKHNGSSFAADRFKRVHEVATHWYQGRWDGIRHEVPRVAHDGPRKSVKNRTAVPHTGAITGGTYDDDRTRLMRSVIRVRSMHGRAIHPTEKPVGVLIPQIEYGCPPGGTIIDPTAGSGSTAVAALLTGRRCVLVEGREPYCEKIAARLSQGVLDLGAVA